MMNNLGRYIRKKLRLCKSSIGLIKSKIISYQSNYKLKKYTVPNRHTFFGYYDKTPFCSSNKKLLAMVGPKQNRPPKKNDKCEVGYFDLDSGNFNKVGETATWCWQQGCRLQWFPTDEERLIIYNDLFGDIYGSIVQDVHTKEIIKTYNTPIYDVDGKGQYAVSLNFSRLHRLRPGYGYVNLEDSTGKDLQPGNDGVWLLDLQSGQKNLIINLKQLSNYQPQPSMENAEHYINHLSFNPSGSRFMFLHLWKNKGKRYSRLITSDFNGNQLRLLENKVNVSHYTWKTDVQLLAHTSTNRDGLVEYRLYSDKDQNGPFVVIGKDKLVERGHPSYSSSKACILVDTYPDQYGEQKLFLYEVAEDSLVMVGSFFSPLKYRGEVRCDLHPRFDRVGQRICFDSAHEGLRSIYVLKL